MDHAQLAAEIPNIEKLTAAERLKLAKKRRGHQLKKYADFERKLDKAKKRKPNRDNGKRGTKKASLRFLPAVGFLEAAARNDIEEVRLFLERGVSPDVTNEDGLTALHQCCIDDSEAMLELLLEYGANVNAKDSELWTPLHAAATCGHIHLCKHLIDKGAELLAVNSDGNMPYDLCEDEATLDYIENEMANRDVTQTQIDVTRSSTETQMLHDVRELITSSQSLSLPDGTGATLLHIACANGYMRVVPVLLQHGADVTAADEDGWRPIHGAACWGHAGAIEALVRHGAEIDSQTNNNESAYDLSEDHEVKQRILALRDELATRQQQRTTPEVGGVRRRTSTNKRSSISSAGSSEHKYTLGPNINVHHSASIRRTSMREKNLAARNKEHEFLDALSQQNSNEDSKVEGAIDLNGLEVEIPDNNSTSQPSPPITAGRSPATSRRDQQEEANRHEEDRREEVNQQEEDRREEERQQQLQMEKRMEEARRQKEQEEADRREAEASREEAERQQEVERLRQQQAEEALRLRTVQPQQPRSTQPRPEDLRLDSNSQCSSVASSPRRASRTREESEQAFRQEQKQAQMHPSPQQPLSRQTPTDNRASDVPEWPPKIGTLAELKKQRRQMMMQRRESSSSVPQSPVTNNGRASFPAATDTHPETVKYRFTAANNEVIGVPEETRDKFVSMRCCSVM